MFDFTNSEGNTDYAPYLSLFGGGFSAASTMLASTQSAKLMQENAAIAGEQARSSNQAGAEQAEILRQNLNQKIGRQEAQVGGSGLTMSGSPLRSIENTAYFGAQDLSRIQTNAARRAWGFQVTQAGDELRAQEAKQAGVMNTFGGLITSGARAYGQWTSD